MIRRDQNRRDRRNSRLELSPRCRRVIKYTFLLVCMSGLSFQLFQLITQYAERRTIVHLEFETLWYNRMPSITICYPNLIAMNKTVEMFPELRPTFKQYNNVLKKVTENDFKKYAIRKRLNDIYEEKFIEFIEEKNLSFVQLSELSIPFAYKQRTNLPSYARESNNGNLSSPVHLENATFRPIDIRVLGLRRFVNGTIRYAEVEDSTPIESVVFNHKVGGEMIKCFTLFSHLNKTMRNYQMNIKEIHITVRHHEDWFPPTMYNNRNEKLLFAMHSPNTIPQNWNTFTELETGLYYEIRYNRWKTVLLRPPYKTGCDKYDLDSISGYRLRSDCVNHCITKELDITCMKCGHNTSDCQQCFVRSDYLWRVETARKDQDVNRKICRDVFEDGDDVTEQEKCIIENQARISHSCDAKCPPDCHNRYYNFAILSKEKLTKELKDSASNWDIETKIVIGHNHMPDQTTGHIEEMTFVTFAGSLGGIFGIWMGLSAFGALGYLLKLF